MGVDISKLKQSKGIHSAPKRARRLDIDLNREISLPKLLKQKFNDRRKEQFFSEMGILLSSGLDISSAFKVVIEQEQKEYEKGTYTDIYAALLKGSSFSSALEYSAKFTTYDSLCVKMGEESGRLCEVLAELSNFYGRKIKYRRKFVSAVSYPILILVTAILAVVFMLNFLVPMFVDVFKTTNSQLPELTLLIIRLSELSATLFPWMLLVTVGVVVLLYRNRKRPRFRRVSSAIMLRLPIFGQIIRLMYLERFLFSMVLLTKSKVSVVESISLIRQMIGFYPYEVALGRVETDIVKGRLLYESLADFAIFDKKIVSLVKVGEEVNQLSAIFEKLNKQYSDDLEYRINNLGNLLEPMLIIFIGILVGIILIAMYLPIFKMGTTIG